MFKNQRGSALIPILVAVVVVLLVGAIGTGAFIVYKTKFAPEEKVAEEIEEEVKDEKPAKEEKTTKEALAAGFATYQASEIKVTPSVKPYTVESDLGNVTNASKFTVKDETKSALTKNAFVVQPGTQKEFFQLYDENRYEEVPSFITTDSMLHSYHLAFSLSLKLLEKEKMIPELKKLNKAMLATAEKNYQELKGTDWENAAKRNVGFFAVGSKLLDSDVTIPDSVKDEVAKEFALIDAHEGNKLSPVMNMGQDLDNVDPADNAKLYKEDYSQYIPRGHYTRSDDLKAYFKSMMWYGRLNFRLKEADEVKSAVLVTQALASSENDFATWEKLYEPIVFFVGDSDDIIYYDFSTILKEVYGENAKLKDLTNETKLSTFTSKAKELDPPQINSMPIYDARFQPDRNEEIMGFRFMGQRFTIDASVFQRLVYREVGDKEHTCEDDPATWSPNESRRIPKGLDVPAAFGSAEAYSILDGLGETDYACYPENMKKMQAYVGDLETATWTQNLYWGWLYGLEPLLGPKGAGYPTFMQNKAWERKELNTFLGSWTELKHDTILYAKQVYAEMGGIMPGEAKGYVEPNPEVFGRLVSLIKMTKEGLEARDILPDRIKTNLDTMEELAADLQTIAEKELTEKPLTDEEYETIQYFGGDLEQFWLEAFKDEGIENKSQIDDRPAALVADVATDPGGSVLEEGVGNIYEILVVVPVEGKLVLTKGGVFSQYEFLHPMEDRLTDEKWREMLEQSEEPDFAEWQKSFMVE
ncbi:MAG: DUF3160 domain-containing protein [Parcubacteria group bacterium]